MSVRLSQLPQGAGGNWKCWLCHGDATDGQNPNDPVLYHKNSEGNGIHHIHTSCLRKAVQKNQPNCVCTQNISNLHEVLQPTFFEKICMLWPIFAGPNCVTLRELLPTSPRRVFVWIYGAAVLWNVRRIGINHAFSWFLTSVYLLQCFEHNAPRIRERVDRLYCFPPLTKRILLYSSVIIRLICSAFYLSSMLSLAHPIITQIPYPWLQGVSQLLWTLVSPSHIPQILSRLPGGLECRLQIEIQLQ